METKRIAVLLATFNRRDKTLACLSSLFAQKSLEEVNIDVYLTDDNSTDGTQDAIKSNFSDVNVLKGTGSLFWAGGMRNSWSEASKRSPDYYLLLNDDTILDEFAVNKLLSFEVKHPDELPAICVGSTFDPLTRRISYGGQKLFNKHKIQSFTVFSENEYLECDMANANIMLVPKAVFDNAGMLSEAYTQSIADFDYSLRASKLGFKVIVIPGVLGYCTDDHGNNWKSSNHSLRERIRYLKSPKGLAYSEYLHFIKVHFPKHLTAAFLKLWLKTLFPFIWDKLKVKQDK